ncbi:MAG TPA: 3'(2'),5'-bisphosphate nucleotidase CysQ [Micromonosporaceae bacterium]|nr:3'(2'),5'-bisphosphate nucleotidase CysQ [Micromonosporaceae bacterium]
MTQDDSAFAAELAGRAGDLLLALREELGFADPAALKATGDKHSHDLLFSELRRGRPADAVLSEEGARTDPARLAAERVWIVDPLDGTREFSEEGRTDWAVHVALWSAGELAAGAVALPARGTVLATDRPVPASARTAGTDGQIRIACSRTRPPAFLSALAEELAAELVPMGSAGVKVCAVVTGEVDAYVHAGGQYEWDSAAPVAVARAAGAHASRIDGSPLVYNRPDPLLPDLLVCRADLAPRLLGALADLIPRAE